MTYEDRSLALAAEVAAVLASHGAKSALIGAAALAVRGYARATVDIDLATVTDPSTVLAAVAMELKARGYETELSMPDADDPLGGVLTILASDSEPVQVVNYFNPWTGWVLAGKEAIETAEENLLPSLAVVDVPHLVALKLFAGGRKSELDILELLDRQPEGAIEEVRAVCEKLGLGTELDILLKRK